MRNYLSLAVLCVSLFFLGSCQSEKTDYVAFLYKYMPTSDSVDYSREYWERQVAMSERARSEMPWQSWCQKQSGSTLSFLCV